MEKILHYSIIDKIDETRNSIIYRAKKDDVDTTIIIKVLNTKYPTPSEVARFKQEYELIKNFDFPGIVHVFDIIQQENQFALLEEDFDGISLKKFLKNKKMGVQSFLKTAVKLSETLGNIHKKNIVHRDIKPHNIIINVKKDIVKITDFGIANELTHKNEEVYHPDVIEGTLPYMSPEQTGRMNRLVDYRTDLYSLGITFYEMLLGKMPFEANDPMEIIHSHIAKEPNPPSKINPGVPDILSAIIIKLLAKNAEERYQNSFGLLADLNECLDQFERTGRIEQFQLGLKDISIKFNMPQIIFGRDNEIDLLMKAFERVTTPLPSSPHRKERIFEIMFVSGDPGIGKSSLINEIHKPIVAKRGYFISGKYDQFRRDVPYSAIIQAFIGLIKQILSESETMIALWKKDILEALGSNGKYITDIMPQVELIIGKQPDVPRLGPEETQNVFHMVFKKFVGVFSNEKHPLVLLLDDLQWADTPSIKLLQGIITDIDINHFFFIGVFRDNKVDEIHSLMMMIEEIKKEGVAIDSIQVVPLDLTNVNKLIANFLRCELSTSMPLSEHIYKKTRGNPFFVIQFLKPLYEEHLIELDPVKGWIWDIEKISTMQVTDNMVDLMAGKITRLPQNIQEILKICACIGSRFDLEMLAIISQQSIEDTLKDMTDTIDEWLIFQDGDLYRFRHDRIQEAAYSLIPDDKKEKMHYTIGNYILHNTKEEEFSDKILFIANHLNAGKGLISSKAEKYSLAELNLKAGIKAKSSAAYEPAFSFLQSGIELLDKNAWDEHYDFSLLLYTEAVECAYLCGNYDIMERLAEIVLKNSRILLDSVPIYKIKMQACTARNNLIETLRVGLDVLDLLGVRLPRKPKMIHIVISLIRTKIALIGKSPEALIDLLKMKDANKLAIMNILANQVSAAYLSFPKLLPLIILKMARISINYGNASLSPYIYSAFGMILASIGEIDNSYRFGELAERLIKKMHAKEMEARTAFVVNTFIRHWKEHVRTTLQPLLEAYQSGLDTGDIEYAAFSLMVYCYTVYYSGTDLESAEREIRKYITVLKSLKQDTQLNYARVEYQVCLNMLGRSKEPCVLTGDGYDETTMPDMHIKANDQTGIARFYANKFMLYYLFNDYFNAADYWEKTKKLLDSATGSLYIPVLHFYASLMQLALYHTGTKNEQRTILSEVAKNQKKIKKWAHYAPMNHLHKYNLVEAERARINGDDLKAMDLYDIAIQGAHDNDYIQEEALANERAALFYLDRGKNKIAIAYMSEAYNCYVRWGATAKVKQLEESYPQMYTFGTAVKKKTKDTANDTDTGTSSSSTTEALDLTTIMKSSQALSSEIDLGKLLETIMKLSIENAGAQKGFLILEKDEDKNLYIEAEHNVDKGMDVLQSIHIEKSTGLSSTIVNYVNKTQEPVVLNDACNEGIFINDAYITVKKPKSILCTPITHKGKVAGILYLENNLTTNAFTPERLELLRILSSQAAISIENARLLMHRENAVRLQTEMRIAEEIQTSLLPKKPVITGYEIVAYMKPADEVGGDYYDIIHVASRDWIVIGDVSGHGVPAGLVMMMVQTAIQTMVYKLPDLSPSELLISINKVIRDNIQKLGQDKYITITIFACHENGRFIFAGLHQDILLFRVKKQEVELVKSEGMWIGIMDDIDEIMRDDVMHVLVGDTVLLFTDGIIEAWRKGSIMNERSIEDMFGQKRLQKVFSLYANESPEMIKNGILKELQDYECIDDVTMVIIRRVE